MDLNLDEETRKRVADDLEAEIMLQMMSDNPALDRIVGALDALYLVDPGRALKMRRTLLAALQAAVAIGRVKAGGR